MLGSQDVWLFYNTKVLLLPPWTNAPVIMTAVADPVVFSPIICIWVWN